MFAVVAVSVAVLGTIALHLGADKTGPHWHRLLEGRALYFTSFSVIAVLAGGIAELVPALLATPSNETMLSADARPYRALELEGRDLYVREGCYTCHSQMIRPFPFEAKRYGDPSQMADSVYDHPFQWGSKRTGPDLAREGGKYPNLWHYRHLVDARSVSPGSNMPPFPTLARDEIDFSRTEDKMRAMRAVGVPYTPEELGRARADASAQAQDIVKDLHEAGVTEANATSEIVALISYLQRLGVRPQPRRGGAAVSTTK